jgi:hypothetical protein
VRDMHEELPSVRVIMKRRSQLSMEKILGKTIHVGRLKD